MPVKTQRIAQNLDPPVNITCHERTEETKYRWKIKSTLNNTERRQQKRACLPFACLPFLLTRAPKFMLQTDYWLCKSRILFTFQVVAKRNLLWLYSGLKHPTVGLLFTSLWWLWQAYGREMMTITITKRLNKNLIIIPTWCFHMHDRVSTQPQRVDWILDFWPHNFYAKGSVLRWYVCSSCSNF